MEREGKIFRDNSIPISKIQDWNTVLDGINSDISSLFADFINYVGALLVPTNTSLTGLTNITIGSDLYLLQDKQRLFLKGQTNISENGLYYYNSNTQALIRIVEVADLLIGSGLSLINNTLSLKLSANTSNILRILPDGLIFRIDPTSANGLIFTEAGLAIDPNGLPSLGDFPITSFLPAYFTTVASTGFAASEQYQPLIGKVFTIEAKYLRTDATVEIEREFDSTPLLLKNIRNIVISIANYNNTLQFTADLVTIDEFDNPLPIGTHRNKIVIKNGLMSGIHEVTGTPYLIYEHEIGVPSEFIITNITWLGTLMQGQSKNITILVTDSVAYGSPYSYSLPAFFTFNNVVSQSDGQLVLNVTPNTFGNQVGNVNVTASGSLTPTTPNYPISIYSETTPIGNTLTTVHLATTTISPTSIIDPATAVPTGDVFYGTAGQITYTKKTMSETYPTATEAHLFANFAYYQRSYISNVAQGDIVCYNAHCRIGLTNIARTTSYSVSNFDYYVEIQYSKSNGSNYDENNLGSFTFRFYDKNGIVSTTVVEEFDGYRGLMPDILGTGTTTYVYPSFDFISIRILNDVVSFISPGGYVFSSALPPTDGYYVVVQLLSGRLLGRQFYQSGHWIAD